MMNDVRRAYFYAKATRDVYIELPKEDSHSARGDMVGKLKLFVQDLRRGIELAGDAGPTSNGQRTRARHGLSKCLHAQGQGHLDVGA